MKSFSQAGGLLRKSFELCTPEGKVGGHSKCLCSEDESKKLYCWICQQIGAVWMSNPQIFQPVAPFIYLFIIIVVSHSSCF